MSDLLPDGYDGFITDLKARIQQTQVRAALSVSRELINLYWEVGRDLEQVVVTRQWGNKVVEQISNDLKTSFPGIAGFSKRNLERMRALHLAYPEAEAFAAQAVSQIPWGHNIVLLQKLKDDSLRQWYAQKTLEHGWSRNILLMQIESKLHTRQGNALTNFSRTLPPPQSDLAEQILKDPYNFDFLMLGEDAQERAIEQGLLEHLKKFLLELGVGFAFVGSQVHLEIGGDDFYLDLLFYHLELRAFVVIELKATAFKPEYAGKLNFYLSAVDDIMRHPQDNASVGLLLCKTKNDLIVEYALKDMSKPMGVSGYQLGEALPENLAGRLPTVEQLEKELSKLDVED